MRPSRRITAIACALLVVFLGGAVFTLNRVDRLRTGSTLEEVLYISSPKVLKRLSLGYEGLLADIYWTRAVQYFGSKHFVGAEQYNLLAPLLEITTCLDPHLVVAYQFGSNFLAPKPPDGAGMPERAVTLMENGIRANPDEWKLYYGLGFIYYWELHDYVKAADAFERGSKRPDAHPFLKIMAAKMAQHAGDRETARMLWITTYESTNDEQIKYNATAHLQALQVEEQVLVLEKLVQQYREKRGHLPESFTDLVLAGILRGIPLDPIGQPYKLMADGRVEVHRPDDIPFLTLGVPPGYKAPAAPNLKHVKPELPSR
jgi:tetratricopeptide (TPR) repeat protein